MENVDIENLDIENLETNPENKDLKLIKYDDGEIHDKAIEFTKILKFRTIRSDLDKKEMFMYDKNNGIYIPHGASYIRELCAKNRSTSNKKFIESFVYHIQNITIIDRNDFINPKNLINLRNGTYDLEADKLLEHSPEYNFQGLLEIEYNKSAECPIWKDVLSKMFLSQSDLLRTQKWFGYQFVRENREQIAHGYFGESGSGKSQILKTMRDLLGPKNVTNFNLQEFSNPNMYALASLYGKYANINYDMSTSQLKDITNFKMITAGDPISARNPYKEPFTFVNHAKLTWACNKLPKISDETINAPEIKRRIMLTETKKGYNDEDIDKDIYSKFVKELPGIFNWAVEGYRLYFKHKGFNYDHDEVPSIWKGNMDSFYGEHETMDDENRIMFYELGEQISKKELELKLVQEKLKIENSSELKHQEIKILDELNELNESYKNFNS